MAVMRWKWCFRSRTPIPFTSLGGACAATAGRALSMTKSSAPKAISCCSTITSRRPKRRISELGVPGGRLRRTGRFLQVGGVNPALLRRGGDVRASDLDPRPAAALFKQRHFLTDLLGRDHIRNPRRVGMHIGCTHDDHNL